MSDRAKIIAVDLDGTLLRYDGNFSKDQFGEPVPGMVEELQKLRDAGWQIIVWTCREATPALHKHLRALEIPYDLINENVEATDSRKIYADVYVDDKGISFDGIAAGLAERVMAHQDWWKSEPW